MALQTFEQVSPEFLEAVTSYLHLEDLYSLIRASNTILYNKLMIQGGIRSITCFENWPTNEQLSPCNPRLSPNNSLNRMSLWTPHVVVPLPHLTTFTWAQNSRNPFLHFLPPTLTNLELQSSHIDSILLPYILGDKIRASSGQLPLVYTINSMFPDLRSLTLCHRSVTGYPAFHMKESHDHIMGFINGLPRSLQKLHTSLFSAATFFDYAEHLPSSLISFGALVTNGPIPTLEIPMSTTLLPIHILLRQLTRLDLPCYKANDGRLFSLLGAGIEHLSLKSLDLDAILYLPQTLTHLTLQSPITSVQVPSDVSSGVYLSIMHPTMKWPPKLRVYRQIEVGTPIVFPHSLDTLELCAGTTAIMPAANILSIVLQLEALVTLYLPSVIIPDSVLLDLPKTLLELHVFCIKQTGFLTHPDDIPTVWSEGTAAICASKFLESFPLRIYYGSHFRFQCNEVANIPNGVEKLYGVKAMDTGRMKFPASLTFADASIHMSQIPVRNYPPNLVEVDGELSLKLSEVRLLPKSLVKVKSMVLEVNGDIDWRLIFTSDLETLSYRDDIPNLVHRHYLPNLKGSVSLLETWVSAPNYLPPNLKSLIVKKRARFDISKSDPLPSTLTHLEIDQALEIYGHDLYPSFPNLSFLKLGGDAGKEFLYFMNRDLRLPNLETLEIHGCKALTNRSMTFKDILPRLTTLRLLGRLIVTDMTLQTLLPTTLTHAEIETPLLSTEAAQWLPSSLSSLTLAHDSAISGDELLSLRDSLGK